MTSIPTINTIASLIDAHHEQREDPPRYHLGPSILGHPCRRWLWLSFRHAVQSNFSGRVLRLFRRGQIEEAQVVADLRAIGCVVDAEEGGKQYRVTFAPHLSGSMDGIIQSGVPEAPHKPHVLEIKTHNKKSFDDLLKNGVEKSKPQHWVQMQCYMLGSDIDRALYFAVCKDDDRIYTERVRLEKRTAQDLIKKGIEIIASDRLPEPVSADPTWYQCKFCDAYSFCHDTHLATEIGCTTCAHVTPADSGEWHCARFDAEIPRPFIQAGCDDHVMHPDLVPWQMQDDECELSAVYVIDGVSVRNGHGGVTSRQILEFVADDGLKVLAKKFGGIVEAVNVA